jgi:hypothetical protein
LYDRDVLGQDACEGIPRALIDDFNRRNRIHGEAETVDPAVLDVAIDEDLKVLASVR